MSDHFAVTVWRNGEEIVTISTNSLSGRDLSPEDEEAIRDAARHLIAFVGDPVGMSDHYQDDPDDYAASRP